MSQALQIRRGLKAALPTSAALGEPLIATDTREMFIGTGTSVYKIGDIIFSATQPAVVKEKVWIDTISNAIYRASDDGTSWITIASGSVGSVTADFQVFGVTQGIYADGNTITAGTSLEDVIKNMLQAIIPPTYSSPTLSIAGSGTLVVEAGTTVTPTITPTFTQRDGGVLTLYELRKNGTTVVSNATTQVYNDSAFVVGDLSVSYQGTSSYDQGPIKNDNQSNPYPTGRIAAGNVVSNTVSYTGRRGLFYAMDTNVAAPTDSAGVRALGLKALNPANATQFTLNIPAGTTRVVIAYPATLRDLTSVKYVELGNGEVKDTFSLATFNVEGADSFTAISYKIYSYVPAIPFGDAVTYTVTI